MLTRIISVAALAALTGTLFTASAAEAGSRWRLNFLNPFYYTYYPRQHDFYSRYDDDDENYDSPDERFYEPEYYGDDEPVYIPQKKKKTTKIVPGSKPVAKKTVASTDKNAIPAVTARKTVQASKGMTCDRAEQIVSGYGFTSVKPSSCSGEVFAFNAMRSGKSYVIKLSSASGELTEVKKVQ